MFKRIIFSMQTDHFLESLGNKYSYKYYLHMDMTSRVYRVVFYEINIHTFSADRGEDLNGFVTWTCREPKYITKKETLRNNPTKLYVLITFKLRTFVYFQTMCYVLPFSYTKWEDGQYLIETYKSWLNTSPTINWTELQPYTTLFSIFHDKMSNTTEIISFRKHKRTNITLFWNAKHFWPFSTVAFPLSFPR